MNFLARMSSRDYSGYTNSAVAAVVIKIEQNVIKWTRLEIFF
jgi:hypothetical protein